MSHPHTDTELVKTALRGRRLTDRPQASRIADRKIVARLFPRSQRHGAASRRLTTLKFGLPAIDDLLPGHGLQSALHEAAGGDAETEHGAAAALFLAGILARQKGTILWVQERPDLFAPALAGVGLPPERVIYLQAGMCWLRWRKA